MLSEITARDLEALDKLYREQVKGGDIMKDEIDHIIEKIGLLAALMEHNESIKPSDGPRQRGQVPRETPATRLEVDGSHDSPAPSPVPDSKPRGLKNREAPSRGSLPPRDTNIKQEPSENGNGGGSEIGSKGKIYFQLGAVVAFRPKATPGNEEPDWIQGEVVKIIGEGKSRRYDVQDPEPDEFNQMGQIYRTSASSMVPIPPLGIPLGDYPKGKTVLARYPDTTTFYRAEVVRMEGSNVVLSFDGEDEKEKTTEVDRRFVLDHKG